MKGHSILLSAVCWLLFVCFAPASVLYVDVNSTNPVPPYADWSTAATNIQDAVDVATNGSIVLVTNGIYATGGRLFGGMTNRVAITNSVTLRSVNGPGTTIIEGSPVIGTNAVRCVWLGNGALLSGFTLTNGATLGAVGGSPKTTQNGGGAYCFSSLSVLSNCNVCGNAAYFWGGGIMYGTAKACRLIGNSAASGGGAYLTAMNNCLLFSNTASTSGGGAVRGTLNNCTLVGNTASTGGGVDGSSDGVLNNCIVYSNTASSGPNYSGTYTFHFALNNCCTVPLATNGVGNFTNEPLFVNFAAGNFRLQTNSPCINAGNNAYMSGGTDLDGRPRKVGGMVDMGAYEFQGAGMGEFIAWLQQSGLPTDGSADYLDSDGDRMNNWQEWIAGTNPTNAASVLLLASPSNSVSGITVTWQSVSGVTYYLQRSTNFPAFTSLQSNLVGQAGSTSYTDTTATSGGLCFYRVGVQ